ncbi:MAG: hypothetical protein JSW40_01240 [Candidatus Omnitrophota bacterium]|nr:MAG: hypothetical protein JSW40_01240 [Candidatus Omnitrophota bacterium]
MDYRSFFIFDSLSKFVGFFVCFFTVIIFIYSLGFIKKKKFAYYSWFFLTFIASLGAVFSSHIIALIIFWGFLGLTLFQLINLYSDKEVAAVAKKTFIIVGGSDGLLLVGLLLYTHLTSHYYITGSPLPINNTLAFVAFLSIAIASFAKAGCMPFHSWIPDTAETASTPVVAYLPASVDKLLGIYLLARIVKDMFILDNISKAILLILGALTVLCAVMMALIQHNTKRLLGYHAVSQVGYMVLGIGCASTLGLAGGLFHMLNHAIYKSCLFLGAGNVEKRAGSNELEQLGGLGKFMPVTFITTLIASFAISGVPPFNGFVSKWMVYQGLIDFMNSSVSTGLKFIIAMSLISALIGSGLTLASFLKLNAGVFLGRAKGKVEEARPSLLISPVVLAVLCIAFGIFASATILPFIEDSVGNIPMIGLWKPQPATVLLLLGILLGLIIFQLMAKKVRISPSFVGGEELNFEQEPNIAPFYNTIKELAFLKKIYALAERKFFDIYEQSRKFTFLFIRFLQYLHNGVLPTYLVWCLLGMIGLFFIFFR